jgi:hypothetical protein
LLYPEPERGGRGNKEKAAETADLLADPLDIGLP